MPANANVLKDDESVIFDKSKKQLLFVQFGNAINASETRPEG